MSQNDAGVAVTPLGGDLVERLLGDVIIGRQRRKEQSNIWVRPVVPRLFLAHSHSRWTEGDEHERRNSKNPHTV